MFITITSPEGPRCGAEPAGGIHDEWTLARALLVTLASESIVGRDRVTLTVDIANVDPARLVAIAKSLAAFREQGQSIRQPEAARATVSSMRRFG